MYVCKNETVLLEIYWKKIKKSSSHIDCNMYVFVIVTLISYVFWQQCCFNYVCLFI